MGGTMEHEVDPRDKYSSVFGETLALAELKKHWHVGDPYINEIVKAGKLTAYLTGRASFMLNKKITFPLLPTSEIPVPVERVADVPTFDKLPDEVFFYWTEILAYKNAPVPTAIGTKQLSIPDKPWLIHNPDDPEPKQGWYTAARYFAREIVKEDPSLLTKRKLLTPKIAERLAKVRIFKRGGKKPLDHGTILKALSNIHLG